MKSLDNVNKKIDGIIHWVHIVIVVAVGIFAVFASILSFGEYAHIVEEERYSTDFQKESDRAKYTGIGCFLLFYLAIYDFNSAMKKRRKKKNYENLIKNINIPIPRNRDREINQTLKELSEMREKGQITEDEFKQRIKNVLNDYES